MHRHCLFILLLSWIIPLQAVAGVLLNAPCPDSSAMNHTAMQMNEMVMTGNTAAMDKMPCCPDKTPKQAPSCKNMNSCHLCKTPGQIYRVDALSLATNLSLADAVIPPAAMFSMFNPASIWRPPSTT